ncbi:hypothetical protein HGG64_01075 [Mycoplasma phocoeninasale]|uniref:Uncharacterized protein n=1 Tax=Mycoplasma phocoeninasale TaxID=2726117 RepID=A0A858U4X6_9MOLU|nr:hypothetical protein [Mycoplasma phocoeninasale]QJG66305.1 hypothetical protein HGG64_01075 [Mycoplasma phocoeninasale]
MNDKQTRGREVNMDNIFQDPIKTFYEPLVINIKEKFNKVFKEKIMNNLTEKLLVEYKDNENTIDKLNKEQDIRYKKDKVFWREKTNYFIKILCFCIIGIFFLWFFLNNSKILRKYRWFSYETKVRIEELRDRDKSILLQVYSRYSLADIKDIILEEFQIKRVHNYHPEELKAFTDNSKFLCFYSVNKYAIRNSHYYDLLYSVLEWKDVITVGSAEPVFHYNESLLKDSTNIYGNHIEKTPFVTIKNATSIATNYLPKFSFVENEDKTMNQDEYNEAIRNGAILLENQEFYKYYGFDFNNEVDTLSYFGTNVQEKFIAYAKYMISNNEVTYPLIKTQSNIYSSREYNNSLLFYSKVHDWLQYEIDLEKRWTIEEINDKLVLLITDVLKPVFKSLTKLYLNRYISSESFNEVGNDYISSYKNMKNIEKEIGENNIYWLNKIIGGRFFSFVTRRAHRNANYQIVGSDYINKTIELTIKMTSFNASEEFAHVYKKGVCVKVPYIRYKQFSEFKKTFINDEFHLSEINAEIYAHNNNNSYAISNTGNENLDLLIRENKITFNAEATKNIHELEKAIKIISKFYSKFTKLHYYSKFLVDNQGISIYINEVNESDVNLELIDKIIKETIYE